jgi:hypothetical protein
MAVRAVSTSSGCTMRSQPSPMASSMVWPVKSVQRGDCAFPGQTLDQYVGMELLEENGQPFSTEDHPLARAIQRGEKLESLSVLHRQPRGSLIHLVVSSRPIFSSEKKIIGGMMMIREAEAEAYY